MGIRTLIELSLQVGMDNRLDDGSLIFDRDIEELLDTMDNAQPGTGTLGAGETNRSLPLGAIAQGRLLYLEAAGDINVYINGVAATPAVKTGSGGTYPTSFLGGETLTFEREGTPITVTFDVADQTLAQVVNRINAAMALAGFATPGASDFGGELRITTTATGSGATLTDFAGSALATLGLAAGDEEGDDPVPATAAWQLRRMAASGGSQIADLKSYLLASVRFSSVFISNADPTETVSYRYCFVGDLTAPPTC